MSLNSFQLLGPNFAAGRISRPLSTAYSVCAPSSYALGALVAVSCRDVPADWLSRFRRPALLSCAVQLEAQCSLDCRQQRQQQRQQQSFASPLVAHQAASGEAGKAIAEKDGHAHQCVAPNLAPLQILNEQGSCVQYVQAVAFQRIMKLGLVAGGSWGSGFVLAKIPCQNGVGFQWSAPSFYTIKGGSVGLTSGMPLYHPASCAFHCWCIDGDADF